MKQPTEERLQEEQESLPSFEEEDSKQSNQKLSQSSEELEDDPMIGPLTFKQR